MSLAALGTSAAQQRVVVQMPGELPAGGDVLSSVTRTMAAVDGSGAAGAGSTAAAQRGSSGAAAGAAAGLVGSGADLAAAPRNQREYHILQVWHMCFDCFDTLGTCVLVAMTHWAPVDECYGARM